MNKKPQDNTKYTNKYNYGGNRIIVLERDNWECQECGMSQEQHMALFGRCLAVHHIDGKGCRSKVKNNSLENLITLCYRCHCIKHTKGKQINRLNNPNYILKHPIRWGKDKEAKKKYYHEHYLINKEKKHNYYIKRKLAIKNK